MTEYKKNSWSLLLLFIQPIFMASNLVIARGASLTGFTLYIFTVYAAIYGYFLFDEKLENYHYFGTALVFFGVYLAKKKNVKQF